MCVAHTHNTQARQVQVAETSKPLSSTTNSPTPNPKRDTPCVNSICETLKVKALHLKTGSPWVKLSRCARKERLCSAGRNALHRNLRPQTLNPKPSTLNPECTIPQSTPANSKPSTLNPECTSPQSKSQSTPANTTVQYPTLCAARLRTL